MRTVPGQGRDLAAQIATAPWHVEDLRIGDWMDLGAAQVHRDEVLAFAARFDPLPIHLDETNPVFGGVIASGVHTLALFSSLASRQFIPRLALVAGRGIEQLRLPVPVRPGATLTGAVEIADIAEQVTRADVTYRSTLTDEEGRVVLSFLGIAVVARRSVAG